MRKGAELLGLLPGQAAAEDAVAAPQPYRHQIVLAVRQPRPGEAHQHAAVLDPAADLIVHLGDVADIGEDHHRQALVEKLGDRLAGRARVRDPHIRERGKRARQVVGRGEQRLRACRRSSR